MTRARRGRRSARGVGRRRLSARRGGGTGNLWCGRLGPSPTRRHGRPLLARGRRLLAGGRRSGGPAFVGCGRLLAGGRRSGGPALIGSGCLLARGRCLLAGGRRSGGAAFVGGGCLLARGRPLRARGRCLLAGGRPSGGAAPVGGLSARGRGGPRRCRIPTAAACLRGGRDVRGGRALLAAPGALLTHVRRGRGCLRVLRWRRRLLRALRVNDEDADEHHDDEADDQADKQADRWTRRGGCGRRLATALRGPGLGTTRGRSNAPRVPQRASATSGGAVAAARQIPANGDHLGDGVFPRHHGKRAVLVGHGRVLRPGRRRLHVPLDAQRQGSHHQRHAKIPAVTIDGLIGSRRHDEFARILELELALVLGAGVHELHVAHRRVVQQDELDAVVGRATRKGLARRLRHSA